MSSLEDSMIEQEVRDSWWEQGEAVMREMTEDEEEIKAVGDEAYDDLISYERLTGTM